VAVAAREMVRRGHEVCVASAGGALSVDFAEAGIRTADFGVRTKSELHPKIFLALPEFIWFVRREGFDLVHAHTRVAQVIAKLLFIATGVPHMSTAHGFYKARLGRRLLDAWGHRVVAVSELVAEDLVSTHRLDASRVRAIPNAVDAAALERRLAARDPRSERLSRRIPSDALVVGSVSRLVKDKGHAFMIEAVARLTERFPKIHLVVLGDGPERSILEKLAAERLPGRSSILRGEKDVSGVLSTLDVFVHPATYREGFGLSIVEAMAVRKPVVATDIWAVNTILKDGVDSRLVAPSDAAALAEAIGTLLDDPAEAKRLGEAGRALAMRISSVEKMGDALEAVYAEVAATGNKKKAKSV